MFFCFVYIGWNGLNHVATVLLEYIIRGPKNLKGWHINHNFSLQIANPQILGHIPITQILKFLRCPSLTICKYTIFIINPVIAIRFLGVPTEPANRKSANKDWDRKSAT
jgi:hypothetical protein